MPGQTVILELPEPLWEWAQRTASVTQRPVEKVLVDSLSATIPPPLNDIPDEFRNELALLETRSDDDLWAITRSGMSAKTLRQYDELLEKNGRGVLTTQEERKLEKLSKQLRGSQQSVANIKPAKYLISDVPHRSTNIFTPSKRFTFSLPMSQMKLSSSPF